MITLNFNTTKDFDVLALPQEWRERVTIKDFLSPIIPPHLEVDPELGRSFAPPLVGGGVGDIAQIATQKRVSISVDVDDSSYRYRKLMERPQLVLKFSLPYYVEFPVGTWCVFQNQRFTLNSPQNIKKQGTRRIEYSMTLGTKEDNLSIYKLRNNVDGRLKFSMCAKPHEFIEELCKNLNARDGAGKWSYKKADIIEATEKTIEFNHTYADAALSSIADTFETEYEIYEQEGVYYIALHKVEYLKNDPLPLSYGRGNGFVPGVGRTTESDGQPIKRLYVQGGEQNIDRSTYGKLFEYSNNPAELRLPKSQSLEHEGRTYTTDKDGYYIERTDKKSNAVRDDSLDLSEIYPSFKGKVTSVETPNEEKNWYDIYDTTIPEELNFNNYLITGENMTLIFQSGMLAGKEFEVKYKHKDKEGNSLRRWELVPLEEDGITYPNATFKPNPETDTYAIFGIMLPKEYICDNTNKAGAAWDMFREAARYLHDHEDQRFTFSGELQALYAKRNWQKIGGYMQIGAYIHFTDDQFATSGMDIRIVGIKDYINAPYSPTLEISNSIQSATSVSSQLQSIDNAEVTIDDAKKSVIAYTKRRFRDALETVGMIGDAQIGDFAPAISPSAVQTMAALIGDESLQFRFIKFSIPESLGASTQAVQVDNAIYYDRDKKALICGAYKAPSDRVYLQHLTMGIQSITADRNTSAELSKTPYFTWPMKAYQSPTLDEVSKKYYLYAKVAIPTPGANGVTPRAQTSEGEFILSEKAIRIEAVAGYYHLLVGILNSELQGERSFVELHGFTEILPGRITTDVITSTDGKTYFNLRTGEIGGRIKFLNGEDGYITLIEGGKIKTELLDVSNIVAKCLDVGEEGTQRITIKPDNNGDVSVKIFDKENGKECAVFEGAKYDDINDLYGSDTKGDVTILSRESESFGYGAGITLGRGKSSLEASQVEDSKYTYNDIQISNKWSTDSPTEIIIKAGHLYASAYASGFSYQASNDFSKPQQAAPSSSASFSAELICITYSDAECTKVTKITTIAYANASAYAQENGNDSQDFGSTWNDGDRYRPGFQNYQRPTTYYYRGDSTQKLTNIAGKSARVPAGYHKLFIRLFQSVEYPESKGEVSWGFTSSPRNDIAAEWNCDFYVSRIYANGLCLGERNDNYVMLHRVLSKQDMPIDAERGIKFQTENGGFGFKTSNKGVLGKLPGAELSSWMPIPVLLFNGIYNFASSTYTVKNGYASFVPHKAPTATRIEAGIVTLTFPEEWKIALGTLLTPSKLLVQVNGYHDTVDARVSSVNENSIRICMSDDSSLNDGNFGLTIFFIA